MLFESISYSGALPFELSFLNVGNESKHCHKEIEILLVLRGVTHFQIYHTDYELNPGDLIIADVEDLHQIHDSSDDILMISIHVDTQRFENLYPNIRYMFFVCEECMEGPSGNKQLLQSKLTLLKQHIAKLSFDYMRENRDYALLIDEVNELVSILVNHFQGFFMEDYQYKTSQKNLGQEDLQRLCRITRYIMLNYKDKISLDDVSKTEHLSSFYLSHLIKENLGFNFQNFVNAIRLEFAEKQLVFSNLTLTQISEECGFSSLNYFNKCFSAWHGKTPAQYRKNYIPCERSFCGDFSKDEALALLSPYLNTSQGKRGEPRLIHIAPDFQSAEYVDFWEHFAPHVVVDTLESALLLCACHEKLERIRPSAVFLSESLVRRIQDLENSLKKWMPFQPQLLADRSVMEQNFINAPSLLSCIQQIFLNQQRSVRLCGKTDALFTAGDLETPIYDIYDFFADLESPRVCVHKDHILVQSRHSSAVLLFNPNPHGSLAVHLNTENLPDSAMVIQREISHQESCHQILNQLDSTCGVPPLLTKRLRQRGNGKYQFTLLKKELNQGMDFFLYHNTVLIVEIIEKSSC